MNQANDGCNQLPKSTCDTFNDNQLILFVFLKSLFKNGFSKRDVISTVRYHTKNLTNSLIVK